MKKHYLAVVIILSLLLFVPLFLFGGLGYFDFWWWMSSNLILLIGLGLILDKQYRLFLAKDLSHNLIKKVTIGLLSAVALYFIFYFGNFLSRWIFSFADKGIENVYAFKGDASVKRIFFLMVLIIGPGEELFWRGFLQRALSNRFGNLWGFLFAALLYSSVHVASGNIMLILAALLCGLFWGWLFIRFKSMVVNIISHTLWDIAVFIFFPFGS